jgi:Zn-finger nucleic acid-binding protein
MSASDAAAMACPHCRVPLVMSERQGIEIDYCPQCRGVWLDRGELDKIIERGLRDAAPAAPPPAPSPAQQTYPPQYREPQYREPHYKHRKHKHWLSDLFD